MGIFEDLFNVFSKEKDENVKTQPLLTSFYVEILKLTKVYESLEDEKAVPLRNRNESEVVFEEPKKSALWSL